MITRSKAHISKPKIPTDGTIFWPLPKALIITSSVSMPRSVSEALKSPKWQNAMATEFQALLDTRTWTLVPLSPSLNVISCKWIFRIKFSPSCSVDKFKARLVGKGFHQQEGVDFFETFSLIVKPVTVRVILSIAVS
ncbi:uncharacterized protein LOC114711730 [Neltuma alba]|uniref:uncharacterized protein LOC114711730 n=1 Tax=Neltuma alba TaxID=207710 RepID=UPI0010A4D98B|nr:uncharacterized protein LOC114711730 [Prosopis alba]